ncbi:MAG: ATP-binding protein [Planctomycetota bacterium]|nr:ATP-binding protein [Planctomycetota bacterium]
MSWLPRRIRSKLIFMHTLFSVALAVVLLTTLRTPIARLMLEAEKIEARLAMELFLESPEALGRAAVRDISVRAGTEGELGLASEAAERARLVPGACVFLTETTGPLRAVRWDPSGERFIVATVRIAEARAAVDRLYLLLTLALLAVYALIAVVMEVFVLPRQVYEPLETLRAADEAVQRGERERELIAESEMPGDELGQIMRSRNESILKLRSQEAQLESALGQIEVAANELRRKNHLLETARRNLADQDRLASLGMMSAGIAHELNTPLAVLKGSVEEIAAAPSRSVSPERAALMLRVLGRLEKLSESLLDFARVRPATSAMVDARAMIDEAWTLVSLDRGAEGVRFENALPPGTNVRGDFDRLVQVFVNLLRNAVDALDAPGWIAVTRTQSGGAEQGSAADAAERRRWVSICVSDSGPGIEPEILPRLFEPFRSTRLDAKGTGLGLAVAEGIVREHGGLILARNAPQGGAIFEVMLPEWSPETPGAVAVAASGTGTLTGDSAPDPTGGMRNAPEKSTDD